MKRLRVVGWFVLILLFVLVLAGVAQENAADVERAASGAVRLRSMMKDPASFELNQVYLLKPDKKGISEICYYYSAKNSYGGYGNQGEAILQKNDSILIPDEQMRSNMFYPMVDSCRSSKRLANITANVISALDPSQLRPEQIQSPADRQRLIAAQNASFAKEKVAGYAEATDDTFIIHSERATQIRFQAYVVSNKDYLGALERAGFARLVYTNDASTKIVYDLKSRAVVVEPGQ